MNILSALDEEFSEQTRVYFWIVNGVKQCAFLFIKGLILIKCTTGSLYKKDKLINSFQIKTVNKQSAWLGDSENDRLKHNELCSRVRAPKSAKMPEFCRLWWCLTSRWRAEVVHLYWQQSKLWDLDSLVLMRNLL